jgi:3-hydroxybutyryl-CoA dehydratase
MSVVSGLSVQTGVMEGTVLAFREVKDWKFAKPVFIGDTIHAEMEVAETKLLGRIGGGSVTIEVKVLNQHSDVVMKGTWIVLIAAKPE